MKKVIEKLHSRRGETLVGILVAILIIALSAGLFATMYTASMNINLSAQKQDEAFYDAVEELEEMIDSGDSAGTEGIVHYEPTGDNKSDGRTVDETVELFTRDGMTAYTGNSGGSTP